MANRETNPTSIARFTMEQIVSRWELIYGREITEDHLFVLRKSGELELQEENFWAHPDGTPVNEVEGRLVAAVAKGARRVTEYWVTQEALDQFEKKNPPNRRAPGIGPIAAAFYDYLDTCLNSGVRPNFPDALLSFVKNPRAVEVNETWVSYANVKTGEYKKIPRLSAEQAYLRARKRYPLDDKWHKGHP